MIMLLQVTTITAVALAMTIAATAQNVNLRPCSAAVHDGDMAFSEPRNGNATAKTVKRGATSNSRLLWPDAVVPYTISNSFSLRKRKIILKAMSHWETHTCIRFKQRTTEFNYINLYEGSGCCSYVGNLRLGQQGVSLGSNCFAFQVVVHELGHVVGFYHEQSRPDRDQYIRVLYNNIIPGRQSQFSIKHQINSLGIGYDYNSIMHYNDNFFAKPNTKTLQALIPDIVLGMATELSPLDIIQANRLYNCENRQVGPPLVVVPPDPTIPPPTLPFPSCGQILTSSTGTITSPGYPFYRHNLDCVWIIRVPNDRGYQVSIVFEPFSIEHSTNCVKDYIEVRSGTKSSSPRVGRQKFCGAYSSYRFETSRGEAYIRYHTDGNNNGYYQGFRLTYTRKDIDECERGFNRICTHGCRNTPGGFNCTCRSGFRLSSDELTCFDINECAIDNGGCDQGCHNRAGSYSCSCRSGYVLESDGRTCRSTSAPRGCASNNGGCSHTCTTRRDGSFYCSCPVGYTLDAARKTCKDFDECAIREHDCDQICVNTVGSFSCSCRSGYSLASNGKACNAQQASCSANNGGCAQLCSSNGGVIRCSCRAGYALNGDGRNCRDINECLTNHGCSHGCQNTIGSYTCTCPSGYVKSGSTCLDINECFGNHGCSHGCRNNVGSYTCTCPSGYVMSGNARTCQDINECFGNHGCSHGCQNNAGSYTCTCPSGYVMDRNGRTCRDINECFGNHGCSHGCQNNVGSYTCTCPSGYVISGNARICQDINECLGNHGCSHGCQNTIGSYTCTCPSGYVKSGSTCLDINECFGNHGCSHSCQNNVGSYTCTCPSGYEISGNARTCQDTNECLGNHGCSHDCQNTIGSYTCTCPSGYVISGSTCLDINECFGNHGCSHGCQNNIGSYTCTCPSGYVMSGDGSTCLDINECFGNHGCSHGCQNNAGSYTCTCPSGYVISGNAHNCQDINECLGNHGCSHGCQNSVGSYTCTCPSGYEISGNARTCIDINECRHHHCSHTCVNSDGSYECTCPSGQQLLSDGRTCHGVCSYNNGGCSHICSSESGNITCSCPTGMVMAFDGTTCVNSSVACGGELMAVNGVVALSIEDVSSDTNCVWVVRAPSSANVLQLEFQGAFNIMRSVSCKDSFLEVRDGDSALSILIGKFCGSISPEIITSSSSALYLRFHSSEMQVVKFNASFTATPAPVKDHFSCGLTHFIPPTMFGTETKKSNSEIFPPRKCQYLFGNVRSLERVQIRLLYADLNGNCNDAKIEIYEELGDFSPNRKKATICSLEEAEKMNDIFPFIFGTILYDAKVAGMEGFRAVIRDACMDGYRPTRNGTSCEDVNECLSSTTCDQVCTNTRGSFNCSCYNGYVMSNSQCTDINECATGNGGCSHTCANTEGSYRCSCPQGMLLDNDQKTCLSLSTAPATTTSSTTFPPTATTSPPTTSTSPSTTATPPSSSATSSSSTATPMMNNTEMENLATTAPFSGVGLCPNKSVASLACGGIHYVPAMTGYGVSATEPKECTYHFGNFPSLGSVQVRILCADLPGSCSLARINVYKGLMKTPSSLIKSICTAEEAKEVLLITGGYVTITYRTAEAGLGGFQVVARDACPSGQIPSKTLACKVQ